MQKLTSILLPLLLFATLFFSSYKTDLSNTRKPVKQRYNVLFIFVDDLRPELGCYGNNIVHSPNLDKLAKQATVFKNQFVTVPTCGPSRACLLTGMWPRTATDLSNDVLEIRKAENIKTSPGDDRVWGKHTIIEWALRSPLIIKVPGKKQGTSCDKIVSSIDVYPTLMELCSIKMPHKTDGKSIVPLIETPDKNNWNNVAYSYYQNGITVRTEQYRFTKYFRKQEPIEELYDHHKDPYENNNIVANHLDVVKRLLPVWKKGDTGLYTKRKGG